MTELLKQFIKEINLLFLELIDEVGIEQARKITLENTILKESIQFIKRYDNESIAENITEEEVDNYLNNMEKCQAEMLDN